MKDDANRLLEHLLCRSRGLTADLRRLEAIERRALAEGRSRELAAVRIAAARLETMLERFRADVLGPLGDAFGDVIGAIKEG